MKITAGLEGGELPLQDKTPTFDSNLTDPQTGREGGGFSLKKNNNK